MTSDPKLTIGLATYDDYHGVYFSIQALRMYHTEIINKTEILVVDNKTHYQQLILQTHILLVKRLFRT